MSNNKRPYLGPTGTEQLVANVKSLLEDKADVDYINKVIQDIQPYFLNIDYDSILGFDTSEIVFSSNATSVLGQAILGQMILA